MADSEASEFDLTAEASWSEGDQQPSDDAWSDEEASEGAPDDEDSDFEEAEESAKKKPKASSKAKKPLVPAKPRNTSTSTKPKAKAKAAPKKNADAANNTGNKPKKVKALSEGDGVEMVKEYMLKQNRPYSAQNVFDNLHKAVKKAQVGRILDALCAEQVLQQKMFGKTAIYLANQAQFPEVSEEQLGQLDLQIKSKNERLLELNQSLTQVLREIKALEDEPDDASLDVLLQQAEQEKQVKHARLEELQTNHELVDESQLLAAKTNKLRHLQMWKKRKRAAMEMVNTICEQSGKKPSTLMEEFGFELDEEHAADLKSMQG